MKRTFTCIVCPNGCEVEAEYSGTQVLSISGNLCPKGAAYVTQELVDPRRTIATSVRVEGGELPLTSVRLTGADRARAHWRRGHQGPSGLRQ